MTARLKTYPAFYVLRGHAVEPCADIAEWARANRFNHVAHSEIEPGVFVSTIFVGVDMAPCGEPLLFETRVFGGECDGDSMRAGSWGVAETQHSVMCARVRALLRCSEGVPLVD